MDQTKRGIPARFGLLILSLLAPGASLLRLGQWKTALAIFAVTLAVLLFYNFGPVVPFAILLLALVVLITSVLLAVVETWRLSAAMGPMRWYTRWYTVVGAVLLSMVANVLLTDRDHLRYRNFYLPSESMAPTFAKSDRFIAYMGNLGPVRRGDNVLVRTKVGDIYVKRVLAIGGDRFAMHGGVVFLNGVPVAQHFLGTEKIASSFQPGNLRRLAEQLPGERLPHNIYDAGSSQEDEVPEVIVPSGRVMLVGDNRDLSADSRVPIEMGGLGGTVPIADLVGRPLYQSWGSSRPLGTKLS